MGLEMQEAAVDYLDDFVQRIAKQEPPIAGIDACFIDRENVSIEAAEVGRHGEAPSPSIQTTAKRS
jgi:hypothetical protein